jgi:hypothetical protein
MSEKVNEGSYTLAMMKRASNGSKKCYSFFSFDKVKNPIIATLKQ